MAPLDTLNTIPEKLINKLHSDLSTVHRSFINILSDLHSEDTADDTVCMSEFLSLPVLAKTF